MLFNAVYVYSGAFNLGQFVLESMLSVWSVVCRQVSVIRGRVVTEDGSSLVGVRVSVVTQPLYGFTLTREQGL